MRASILKVLVGGIYKINLQGLGSVETRGISSDRIDTIAARLVSELGEFESLIVSQTGADGEDILIESQEPGQPIASGVSIEEPAASYVEQIQPGKEPVLQEVIVTLPGTTTGGNWTLSVGFDSENQDIYETTGNISGSATPASVTTAMEALSSASSGDFETTLSSVSPRSYRIKVKGNYAGKNLRFKASGANLSGNATAHVETVQNPGQNAPSVWAVHYAYSGDFRNVQLTINGSSESVSGPAMGEETFWNSRIPEGVENLEFEEYIDAGTRKGLVSFSTFSNAVIEVIPDYSGSQQALRAGSVNLQGFQIEGPDEFLFVHSVEASRTYTLSGETTTSITSNSQLDTVLEALPSVDPGDIEVYSPFQGEGSDWPVVVHLTGSLANTNPDLMACSVGQPPALIANGGPLLNEIQEITIIADGGTFPLSHSGNGPTAGLAYNVSAGDMQTALEGLASIGVGGCSVSKSGNSWRVEFIGANAQTDMAKISTSSTSLTGGAGIYPTGSKTGVLGQNEIQAVHIDPTASSGSYRLGFGGLWTVDQDHDEDPTDVEADFEALSTVGAGNGTVSGSETDLLIEFTGSKGLKPQDLIKIDQDGLNVSDNNTMSLKTETLATGPNHWTNSENWTLGHVPCSGERVSLYSGNQPILHGLNQVGECTYSIHSVTLNGPGDLVDGCKVRLRTTGALPTAEDSDGSVTLSTSADYFIVGVDVDSEGRQVLQIAETENGEAIEFTSAGSGTHRIGVYLDSIDSHGTFTGSGVGLPQRVSDEWIEAPRFLKVGLLGDSSPNLTLGLGEGTGPDRLNFDFQDSPLDALVLNSQAGQEEPAISLRIQSLSSGKIDNRGGTLGLGLGPSEPEVQLSSLASSGGSVRCGNVRIGSVVDYTDSIRFQSMDVNSGSIRMAL
ncbi:hypothetical protein [Thalassoglobus neptunius]|uniref:hypothetical protein n=1 Tax=Thalassoglobus neptunius TaxID=1938619 RepID=UPI001E385814|nr:hypothetical protein [Thalassoglobus neptunius]